MPLKTTTGLFAAAIFGTLALGASAASAAPTSPASGPANAVGMIEEARLVCGPYRCRRAPNFAPRFYGGPRRFHGPRFYGPRPYRHYY